MKVQSWSMVNVGAPMVWGEREEQAGPNEAIIQIAGCGICHTDIGFWDEGVPTRHALPLTLGHEVSGTVVEAGAAVQAWLGRTVVVPAVIPCGVCHACQADRSAICPEQVFPGNDVHGGFGTHLRVPAHALCEVPDLADPKLNPGALKLEALSVIADAVSTAYQAVDRSGASASDLAIIVGVGGVGGFAAQIAKARGMHVIGIDRDDHRLELMQNHGVDLALSSETLDFRSLRKQVRGFAAEHGVPTWRQFVFETSGTTGGQRCAFGLLGHGGYLSIVGYTPASVELCMSKLMALDATVRGTWGCAPNLYPQVLELVLSGAVSLEPFVEYRPLSQLNSILEAIKNHQISKRVVVVPEL